jgi:hypothetical protein
MKNVINLKNTLQTFPKHPTPKTTTQELKD